MLKLLQHKNFMYLLYLKISVIFADTILFMCLLKWIEIKTQNTSLLTILFIINYLPMAILSIPVGIWIEKYSYKKVIRISIVLKIMIFIIGLTFINSSLYYSMLIIIFCNSCLNLLFLPAVQSLIPMIVTNEEQRPFANSFISIGTVISLIVGNLFVLITIKLNISISLLLYISLILLCIGFIYNLKLKYQAKFNHRSKYITVIKSIKDIFKNHLILKILFIYFSFCLIDTSVDIINISYLKNILRLETEDLSFIHGSYYVGMLIGSLFASIVYFKCNNKFIILSSFLTYSFHFLILYIVPSFTLIIVWALVVGVFSSIFNVFIITTLQNNIEQSKYASFFSIYNMIIGCSSLIGMVFFDFIINKQGVLFMIALSFIFMLLIGVTSSLLINKKNPNIK